MTGAVAADGRGVEVPVEFVNCALQSDEGNKSAQRCGNRSVGGEVRFQERGMRLNHPDAGIAGLDIFRGGRLGEPGPNARQAVNGRAGRQGGRTGSSTDLPDHRLRQHAEAGAFGFTAERTVGGARGI
ncbi:hypothetical protein ACIHFE_09205 [Streptomyces sp. NPDC052396]|uniref:hypothetical protein n=1 Tax=Streptomyces sp. NPDC052396 TaxID=3365689 RepID=UPI0037D78DD9